MKATSWPNGLGLTVRISGRIWETSNCCSGNTWRAWLVHRGPEAKDRSGYGATPMAAIINAKAQS